MYLPNKLPLKNILILACASDIILQTILYFSDMDVYVYL